MLLRYALLGAAAIAVAGIAEVQAQSPFPPVGGQQTQQSSPFPPVGGQQPQQSPTFPPVGGQQPASPFTNPGRTMIPQMGQMDQAPQQQQPPCAVELTAAGQEMEKRMIAAKAGMDKKLGAAEMCRLITQYTVAEEQLIKSLEKNSSACGVPLDTIKRRKAGLTQANVGKKQACDAAANPQRAPRGAEPTLSDAFAPPPLNGSNTRTGRGTLDSLGGNPLAR